MSKEKLIINNKNYEGYKKLLDVNSKMSNKEYRNNANVLKKAFFTFLIGMIIVTITPLFIGTGVLLKNIMFSELLALMGVESAVTINYLVNVSKLKKEKNKMVKENYPYVNTSVDLSELENKLKNYEYNKENGVDFVQYEFSPNNRVIEEGNVSFENINTEEYLECFIQPSIYTNSSEQMEKNKVKKLTR